MSIFCPTSLYRGKDAPLQREYTSWRCMICRCNYKSHKQYKDYGGRGITVCDRWMGEKGFLNFVWDMGARPKDGTLDRINLNDGYRPGNCRWSTKKEQARHTRNTIYLEYSGEVKSLPEWADSLNMPSYVLYSRIYHYHWTIEKALLEPYKKRKTNKLVYNENHNE